jgi:Spy/CpxP family protein refolding chaperone
MRRPRARSTMKKLLSFVAFVLTLGGAGLGVWAQGRLGQQGAANDAPAVSPAELQRMFDAYALLQAQEQLKISDEQYSQFLTRFKALQDTRRKTLVERTRIIQDLRRLLAEAQPDEGQIKDRLKALQDVEARGEVDARKAYDAIDQVLDVQQQAKFRIFEEQMERRKLELVARARQANRARAGRLDR